MPTRAIGYARVSTERQAGEGVSLAAQQEKIRAYCVAMDLTLIGIEVDAGISAKTIDRPALQAALTALREGRADALLVTKLDRLTRSVRDLGTLVEDYFASGRWALLSVSDSIDTRSASGRLVLNVLMSVAQWEREAIGERTRDALAHLRKQGVRLGPVPLGVRRSSQRENGDGRRLLESWPEGVAAVRRAQELRTQGHSLRQIARQLEQEGHATQKGGKWAAATVLYVLRREPDCTRVLGAGRL